jgi:hypothetical protein
MGKNQNDQHRQHTDSELNHPSLLDGHVKDINPNNPIAQDIAGIGIQDDEDREEETKEEVSAESNPLEEDIYSDPRSQETEDRVENQDSQ